MKKVLIVDDVPVNVVLIHKMLTGFPLEFDTAGNGEIAMHKIKENQPDIVLLDLLMPVVDGFTVLQEIRSGNCGDSQIPIVVLSALSGSSVTRAIEMGANDFLTKPIVMTRLRSVVEKLLEL